MCLEMRDRNLDLPTSLVTLSSVVFQCRACCRLQPSGAEDVFGSFLHRTRTHALCARPTPSEGPPRATRQTRDKERCWLRLTAKWAVYVEGSESINSTTNSTVRR